MVTQTVIVFVSFAVFAYFAYHIVSALARFMIGAVTSHHIGEPKIHADDLWDENDGTTYIVLPNGERRLDIA